MECFEAEGYMDPELGLNSTAQQKNHSTAYEIENWAVIYYRNKLLLAAEPSPLASL